MAFTPTTSGTYGQTIYQVSTILDTALRRAGKRPTDATEDDIQAITNCLFLTLVGLANSGINLWTIQKQIIGLNAYQETYPLLPGTQSILKGLYRTITNANGGTPFSSDGQSTVGNLFAQNQALSFTQTAPNGYISYAFGGNVNIKSLGILPFGGPTLSLVGEYSMDNEVWTQVAAFPTNVACQDNVWQYIDIDGPSGFAPYFRIRETGGGTISARSLVFGHDPNEITMAPMNKDSYMQQNTKAAPQRQPTQYWYDRQINPQVHMWQMPNYSYDQAVMWCTREIQDVGALNNILQIPTRWYDAVISETAWLFYLETPIPQYDQARANAMEKKMIIARQLAGSEETDGGPIEISSDNSAYTD